MARSPLTLAASVTSALPGVGVVAVGVLSDGGAGRYDAVVADLTDDRRVIVRSPSSAEHAADLAAEIRALRVLTPGVRALLPFQSPELLGEVALEGGRAAVMEFLPGYHIDAVHLPPGRGAATSLGEALAAIHALPASVVRADGLPARTPEQVRQDAARTVERAQGTKHLPVSLAARWQHAIDADELWRFESSVILGGAGIGAFLFDDIDDEPRVTGVLEWQGLAVGDPAIDLQWLASAPNAADDLFAAYVHAAGRAPDAHLRDRARLYAELEFAKWLVHGYDNNRDDIIRDASALLESLAEGVIGDEIISASAIDVDDVIAPPGAMAGPLDIDTSMQTDAYDPEELAQWLDTGPVGDRTPDAGGDPADTGQPAEVSAQTADDPDATADLTALRSEEVDRVEESEPTTVAANSSSTSAADRATPAPLDEDDARADADRASQAALKRWLGA